MSSLRDRVSDAVSNHPDSVVLGFACVVLFLVIAIYLWSRRAARLETAVEELTASRDALTHLLQRPEPAGPDKEKAGAPERYSIVERAPGATREPEPKTASTGSRGADPAAPAWGVRDGASPDGETKQAEHAVTVETHDAVHGDTTVRVQSVEIPATWRADDEDVTPAAAAWAVSPETPERELAVSPFTTMSFAPLSREDVTRGAAPTETKDDDAAAAKAEPAKAADPASWSREPEPYSGPKSPAFSFARPDEAPPDAVSPWASPRSEKTLETPPVETAPAEPQAMPVAEKLPTTPEKAPDAAKSDVAAVASWAAVPTDPPRAQPATPPPTPEDPARPAAPAAATPLQEAYGAWESFSRAPQADTVPAAEASTDPAYAAWHEVTSASKQVSPAVEETVVHAPSGANGNGHVFGNANGNGNHDDNGTHDSEAGLAAMTTLATPMPAAPVAPAGISLPEPAETPSDAPARAVADSAGTGGGILLVEDDANVAKIYRLVLENKGHTVRHAGDGVAALEEIRRGRPDLVLLDVMMPRMNGILFLQSLRAQADMRDVPVVILSNFREPRLVERAMALGALEYVVKAQTRPDVLVGAVPRWLAGERAFSA